nr:hypothetical protein [uncultured Oscillibacter sp.]
MENYSFKSVAFGGFDKQDVVRYLEQASEKAAARQRELETENEDLRKRMGEQDSELRELRAQVEELTAQREQIQEELEAERSARADLEPLRTLEADLSRTAAERDALRPDAERYARFRERLGAIECEARDRADALEAEAAAQTRRTAEEFRTHYRRIMSSFESTAGHVNSELRKIEVMLSQLPRALDQTGTELDALAARLEKGPEAGAGKEKKD